MVDKARSSNTRREAVRMPFRGKRGETDVYEPRYVRAARKFADAQSNAKKLVDAQNIKVRIIQYGRPVEIEVPRGNPMGIFTGGRNMRLPGKRCPPGDPMESHAQNEEACEKSPNHAHIKIVGRKPICFDDVSETETIGTLTEKIADILGLLSSR